VWSRDALVALTLLAFCLVGYIVLTLTWEDFAYFDNSQFTLVTLKGHDLGTPIQPHTGRFFPLGFQEFDLIRHFTSSVAGYHMLPVIQLLALCGILLILDDEISISARAALTGLVLVSPGIVTSFGGLLFMERNVLPYFACLVLSTKRFEQTQSPKWAVCAVICAQFMIYYKETAFLLLLGFALGRLILRCKSADQPGWNYERLRDKESRLDLYLASLAILFLVNYLVLMLPHLNLQYARAGRVPAAEAVLAYIKLDLLAWLFVAVVVGRVYLITRRGVPPSPLWDGLAFGGVACFTAYLYLRIVNTQYVAPVDFIAVLYVGRLVILSWAQRSWVSKVPIMALLGVVVFHEVALSAFRVYERKNVIHGKGEIASAVKARYRSGAGNVRRLYFPFASPYSIMEFGAYLTYRGVPVEGVPVDFAGLGSVAIASKAVAKDGPCVWFRTVLCHASSRPDHGDLVIILPDDDASLREVTPYRERGELLLSYEPHPRIPELLCPFVSHLHIASYAILHPDWVLADARELPDRWLDASATLW
jgi:hypothetical protein